MCRGEEQERVCLAAARTETRRTGSLKSCPVENWRKKAMAEWVQEAMGKQVSAPGKLGALSVENQDKGCWDQSWSPLLPAQREGRTAVLLSHPSVLCSLQLQSARDWKTPYGETCWLLQGKVNFLSKLSHHYYVQSWMVCCDFSY